jgi:hypothetical protein
MHGASPLPVLLRVAACTVLGPAELFRVEGDDRCRLVAGVTTHQKRGRKNQQQGE